MTGLRGPLRHGRNRFAGAGRQQIIGRAIDGFKKRGHGIVGFRHLVAQAEFAHFALTRRHVERPKQPIPDRKAGAHVAVVMFWIDRVMHLVVCGAQQNAAPDAGERDPRLRMLQMDEGVNKENEQNVTPDIA